MSSTTAEHPLPLTATPSRSLFKDKRILLTAVVIALLAGSFWASSRVPALNEKAIMGGETQLDALGFEIVFPIDPDDPLALRLVYTTINWLETNKKGMTFGVLFAAALMVLLTLLQKRSFKSGFANTLLGMTIGAPLGVCVNCAAPIAKGLHSAGAPAQTMLAAMMSSPTLNVIVLTMLFALFPLYMVVIKLGFTVAFIVVAIPLTVRFLRIGNVSIEGEGWIPGFGTQACALPELSDTSGESWLRSSGWVVRNFAKNLWYIIKTTVPLMFVAGFLGAVIVTLLPWDSLADVIPKGGPLLLLASMGFVALVGIILPVPIAFDVIVPATLLAAGMPIRYAMILLFTLGIYSIYAFFIIHNSMAKRVAYSLVPVLLVFGVAAGVVAHEYAEGKRERQQELLMSVFGDNAEAPGPSVLTVERANPGLPEADLVPQLRANAVSGVSMLNDDTAGISIEKRDFQPSVGSGKPHFTRFDGQLGLDEPYSYSVLNFATLSRFRGVAAADVHNDGWSDILITSDRGISLYANRQGSGFVLQQIASDALPTLYVVNAALVDLDNDGWLDIFLSSYRQGNYVIYNRQGQFSGSLHPLPNHQDAITSPAAAFGDIDTDGDLDIVVGNWSLGSIAGGRSAVESSRNALLENGASGFVLKPLAGTVGETLAALLSDLDNDGHLDLLVANDFRLPDDYYLGDGKGGFRHLARADSVIPHSTTSTMSFATADLNNDLVPELYVAQISLGTGGKLPVKRNGPKLCDEIGDAQHRQRCKEIMSIQWDILRSRTTTDALKCRSTTSEYQDDCIAVVLLINAAQTRDQKQCEMFPATWEQFSFICNKVFSPRVTPTEEELSQAIRQIPGTNVLLMSTGDGRFVDQADKMGLEFAGWTWNAKFGDVDNDEWQDLYAVNGEFSTTVQGPNLFYRNQGGQNFVEAGAEYGLGSYLATNAYTYVDMDNDGDLDIISVPAVGPIITYRNNSTDGNAIAFELRDQIGNSFGIGGKIIIHYGPDGKRSQMREIQAGGGYLSYDPPVAHFGLGGFDRVSRVEVLWSTGQRSTISGDFSAGARYKITRHTESSGPGS